MTAAANPTHHPSCRTLMRHAAGTLSQAMRLIVACHMDLCPHCRHELQAYEAEAGLGLEALAPEAMDTSCLENLMLKIDENGPPACIDVTIPIPPPADARLPEPLHEFTGRHGERIAWEKESGPATNYAGSYEVGHLRGAGGARLLRLSRELIMPTLQTPDLFLLLDGSLSVNNAACKKGDMVEAGKISAILEDSLCLVVTPENSDSEGWFERLIGFFQR